MPGILQDVDMAIDTWAAARSKNAELTTEDLHLLRIALRKIAGQTAQHVRGASAPQVSRTNECATRIEAGIQRLHRVALQSPGTFPNQDARLAKIANEILVDVSEYTGLYS